MQSPFRLEAAQGLDWAPPLLQEEGKRCPLHVYTATVLVLNAETWLGQVLRSAWASSQAQLSCPAMPQGLGVQVGPGPVAGPQRSGQLRKLVTFPRADSQAVCCPVLPSLPQDPPS